MKKKINTKNIALTGVLMALVILSILWIKIPTGYGYIHIADSFILLSGITGPFMAFLVGGVGAMVSDFLVGYPVYAPWSLVVHGLQAIVMALLLKRVSDVTLVKFFILGLSVTFIFVVLGYALAEAVISGTLGAAVGTIPLNVVQAISGAVIGTALYGVYKNFIVEK